MSWMNIDGQKQSTRPIRVRLPDGMTRTNEEVTDEVLSLAGWSYEADLAGPGIIEIISTSTQSGEVL